MVAKKIYNALQELQTACETIKDLGECGKCPMRTYCIDDESTNFGEAVYNVSYKAIDEFMTYAESLIDIGV